jgi:hypothetical protein
VDYIIRAALADETNDGWVWIGGPAQKLEPRTVVIISRSGLRRYLYTCVRTIDDNFRKTYNHVLKDDPKNDDPKKVRYNIDADLDTIVMAEWYRNALAIDTTKQGETKTIPLLVKKARIPIWRSLRAACHHPDPVVVLGTRLGLLSTWLGLLGVWLGLVGVCPMSSTARLIEFGPVALVGGARHLGELGAASAAVKVT